MRQRSREDYTQVTTQPIDPWPAIELPSFDGRSKWRAPANHGNFAPGNFLDLLVIVPNHRPAQVAHMVRDSFEQSELERFQMWRDEKSAVLGIDHRQCSLTHDR